jgi:hypothetical protein
MAELEGNVLRPPGFGPTKTFDAPEELLAQTGQGYLQKGGTVLAGVGILRVGEPIKRSSDGKTWIKASYGTATALNRTAVDATAENKLINVVLGGVVNARVQAITPTNAAALATALGGTYITGFDHIKF